VVEAYLSWRPFDGLLLTPDVQYFGNPANGAGRDGAWIWSLRTTLLF
jgi:carbohydrate-selective porin OprB